MHWSVENFLNLNVATLIVEEVGGNLATTNEKFKSNVFDLEICNLNSEVSICGYAPIMLPWDRLIEKWYLATLATAQSSGSSNDDRNLWSCSNISVTRMKNTWPHCVAYPQKYGNVVFHVNKVKFGNSGFEIVKREPLNYPNSIHLQSVYGNPASLNEWKNLATVYKCFY